MSLNIENYLPVVQYNGFNTAKAQNITAASGAYNFDYSASSGTFKFPTGAVTFGGGAVSGLALPIIQSALVGATVVLTAAQSGAVCINRSTSGSPSWTLPAATTAGLEYTFVCGNTTAGFTVTNVAAQVIHFKTSASGTVLTSTTTLTNTQATAIVGDFITIVSDGAVWWMTSISGIFAAS